MKKINKLLALLVFSFTFLAIFLFHDVTDSFADSMDKTVKVGFFYYPCYNEISENGKYSGFGFEITEKLRAYAGWDVEYVGYENSWPEMLEMLVSGDVDMLLNVSRTPQRDEVLNYSETDIGIANIILAARSDDSRFSVKNYSTFDGACIGILAGDIANEYVEEYASSHGFEYTVKYFDNFDDIHAALLNKEVDITASSCFRKVYDDEKVLDSFGDDYCYIATAKSNKALMAEIDKAIDSLLLVEPNVFSDLKKKYFGIEEERHYSFSREEREYLEKHKDIPIKAFAVDGIEPLAYSSEGEVKGIITDYLSLISEITGLSFEVDGVGASADAFAIKDKYDYDLRLDAISDYGLSNYYGYKLTTPYLKFPMSYLMLNGTSEPEKIGFILVGSDLDMIDEPVIQDNKYEYVSINEAINALNQRTVDALFLSSYVAQYVADKDVGNNYYVQTLPEKFFELSFGVYDDVDNILCSILSKAVTYVNDTDVQRVIAQNVGNIEKDEISLKRMLDRHPYLAWGGTIVLLVVAAVIIILAIKAYASKKLSIMGLENLSFFRTVLDSNIFAIRLDVSKDKNSEFRLYLSDKSTKNSMGITVTDISLDEIADYRKKVYFEDVSKYDHVYSDENIQEIIETGKSSYDELRVMDPSGKYIYVAVTMQVMPKITSAERFLICVKDIDKSKREEEEKRNTLSLALETAKNYSESKTRFLSQMSHDIRTPLNAIVGMANIAQNNMDNHEKVKECLDIINDSSDHLLSLINDILDMTRIESGKLSFSNTRFSIKDSLEKSVSMQIVRMHRSNISYTVDKDHIEHEFIVSDPTRMEQVFSNIISNAVKYTNPGGHIDIVLKENESTSDETFFYEFEVKDTGIGMSEATLSKLFNPFERAREVEFVEGTGLGMAITKNIVDALGGIIKVSSKEGVGTTVNISFAFSDNVKNSLSEFPELENQKALLITSDMSIKGLVTSLLTEGAMEVDSFPDFVSFSEALNKNEEKPEYKVIVLALMQPLSVELTYIKRIREIFGNDPILMDITAEDYSGMSASLQEIKFNGFVNMPVYRSNVIRIVENELEKSKKHVKKPISVTAVGKKALIVEDVEINAMFSEAIAQMKGFTCDIAENGKVAVEKLENSEDGYYSIVLMDIQMPVMNGYEATRKIRASEREYLKNIPIIAMSANAFEEDVLKCKVAGMNDHIAKPVDINRFSNLVDIYVKD